MGRFWNGRWGRMVRRDIWLHRQPAWVVRARLGDADAPVKRWDFDDEETARAWVQHLMNRGGDGWKETTDLYDRTERRSREPM